MTIVLEGQSCQMLHDVENTVTISTTRRVGHARADNKRRPRLQATILTASYTMFGLRCPTMTKTSVYTESKSQAPGLHRDFKCSSECPPTTVCKASGLCTTHDQKRAQKFCTVSKSWRSKIECIYNTFYVTPTQCVPALTAKFVKMTRRNKFQSKSNRVGHTPSWLCASPGKSTPIAAVHAAICW